MEFIRKSFGRKSVTERSSMSSINSGSRTGGSRRSSIFTDLLFLLRRSSSSRLKLHYQQSRKRGAEDG